MFLFTYDICMILSAVVFLLHAILELLMCVLARHVRFITAYLSHCDFAAYLLVRVICDSRSPIFLSVYNFSISKFSDI